MNKYFRRNCSKATSKRNTVVYLSTSIMLLVSSFLSPTSQTAAQTNTTPFQLNWSSVRTDSTLNISWGDYDGDGDLDLAVANGGTRDDGSPQDEHDVLYRNTNGVLDSVPVWESDESAASYSIAWGDYDGDGDLDLAVGNKGVNRLYRNEHGTLSSRAIWTSSESDFTRSVAWGDYDGDGDLDLAVGNVGQPNRLYRNDSGVLTASAVWSSAEAYSTWSVAWGDYDGDGDLDLVAGNGGFDTGPSDANNEINELYRNDNATLTTTSVWLPHYTDATTSVAWGDYDKDGDLDLLVGNFNETSYLYENEHGTIAAMPIWMSQGANTTSVTWVDYDSDGDLDVALGNESQPLQIYRNEGARPSIFPTIKLPETDRNYSVAWADYDSDGDFDLATGNFNQPIHIYNNTIGVLSTRSQSNDVTASVAWGDYDNDGDLDLVVGNGGANFGDPVEQPERLYRNDGGVLTARPVWESSVNDATSSVAWGDYDGDGFIDLLVGNNSHPTRIYRNNKGQLETHPIWNSFEEYYTTSARWGDYDGDGDLDIALGGIAFAGLSFSFAIYRNDGVAADGVTPILSFAIYTQTADSTTSIDWADYDNDGDLDLVVGNLGLGGGTNTQRQPNRIYRNDGKGNDGNDLFVPLDLSPDKTDITWSIAWGDYDKDGHPDLAVGNQGADKIYHNNGPKGGYTFSLVWTSNTNDLTRSIAWVDYDGDGDLDLSTGNQGEPNRVFRNDNKIFTTDAVWEADTSYNTTSVSWGDYDGDGRPDLAVGNIGDFNQLYHNQGDGTLAKGFSWTSSVGNENYSTAWGDYDGDGDLDLAVGKGSFISGISHNLPDELYRNDNGVLSNAPMWKARDAYLTTSLAWGDYDNDGDLDLVTGNGGFSNQNQPNNQPEQLYRNDNGVLTTDAVWSSAVADSTYSVAWGDYDGDGDLDLMVGNTAMEPSRLYRNDQGQLTNQPVWETPPNYTTRVAWGDYDGDGDLDLVLGNSGNPSQLYRNDGLASDRKSPVFTLVWSSALAESTWSVAWGDYDGDGDLDLAVGNEGPNRVYRNDDGMLTANPIWSSAEASVTYDVAWNDYDNDGDLDLVAGNGGQFVLQPTRLYRNDNGTLTSEAAWQTAETGLTTRLAWGDYDNDGDSDLVTANIRQPFRLYRNNRTSQGQAASPTIKLARPGLTPSADLYSTSQVLTEQVIPITYTLAHPFSRPVLKVIGMYSVDGGGQWLPAVATTSTITTNLNTSPSGTTYVYNWDLFQSGVFGQSDNVVFRLVAVPAPLSGHNQSVLPNMYSANAATTTAFRVRGTQVRVFRNGSPVSGALVYRLPVGQIRDGSPLASGGQSFHTDTQGYLQGRGKISIGDQLISLLPVVVTDTYTLYYTSANPTAVGLDAYTVKTPGIQTLTVSSDNPLMLLNLDVSLEWDARYDKQYLTQLETNLKRTSELLYDWTDGQVALGRIRVYQDHEKWNDAHIRIYATNRLRPNANQGGIVGSEVTDPKQPGISYEPGQVRIGAVWNRFGDPGGALAEDWPRTLAHELGHYAFFLDDDYLGLDDKGLLVSVEGCPSAMSDPYRDDYSEFHLGLKWLSECASTLSNQNTGRSDWATIATFYPWLHQPDALPMPDPIFHDPSLESTRPELTQVHRQLFLPLVVNNIANPGPSSLPLDVTQVEVVNPVTSTEAIDVPIFYLTENGSQVQPGSSARAFLFSQEGDRLTDLGSPNQDRVLARGARIGDRLCVHDAVAQRLGCEIIRQGDEQLALVNKPNWRPSITVTPVTSRTITLAVKDVPEGLPLKARLFPVDGSAPPEIALEATADGYTGTFSLPEPALDGFVQVWVDEPGQRRELIIDYTIGGNPGKKRGLNSPRGDPGKKRGLNAPITSADGEVILFGKNLSFQEGEFFTLQATTSLPSLPAWTTIIGQGYQLTASPDAPSLQQTSINFGYLGTEVPPGEEEGIRVYFYDQSAVACQPYTAPCWRRLTTNLDTYHNEASAPTQGPGLYALMTSIELPLTGPGWNLVSYPVHATRPVTEALSSIDGFYTTVYHYDQSAVDGPWQVYDVGAPDWVNDLDSLEFGQGYWINATNDVTLLLKGGSSLQSTTNSVAASIPIPPATFYGAIQSSHSFVPTIGMPVTARVGTKVCGQGQTREVDGQIVYAVKVLADSGGSTTGCGVPGRTITFQVGGRSMTPTAVWDNSRVRLLALR